MSNWVSWSALGSSNRENSVQILAVIWAIFNLVMLCCMALWSPEMSSLSLIGVSVFRTPTCTWIRDGGKGMLALLYSLSKR